MGSGRDGQRSGLGGGGAGRGEDGRGVERMGTIVRATVVRAQREEGEEGLTGRLRRGEAFTGGGAVDFFSIGDYHGSGGLPQGARRSVCGDDNI